MREYYATFADGITRNLEALTDRDVWREVIMYEVVQETKVLSVVCIEHDTMNTPWKRVLFQEMSS